MSFPMDSHVPARNQAQNPDWGRPFITPKKPIWGVTGGIASGKSTFAQLLSAKTGAKVLDADKLGHEALNDPKIIDRVKSWGGENVVGEDGNISRAKIGAYLFPKREKLAAYESIIHPWIRQRLVREIQRFDEDSAEKLLILDASLLWESGWHRSCSLILHIDAPLEIKLQRVITSRGWTPIMLNLRESLQMPLTLKALLADYCLTNSHSLDRLNSQVDALLLGLTI